MFSRFDRTSTCDRRTDRQTDRQMDIVSHGKNIHEILIKTEGNSQYSL